MSLPSYPALINQYTAPKKVLNPSSNAFAPRPPFKIPDNSLFRVPNPNETLPKINENDITQSHLAINNSNLNESTTPGTNLKKNKNLELKEISRHIMFEESGVISNPERFIYCGDPILAIEKIKNAIIMQPVALLEMVSGHVTENEYNVFFDSPEGLIYAFHFKENSNYCARNCCQQKKRCYEMIGRHVPSSNELEKLMNFPYLTIDRPCGCPCFCCNCCRPYMMVKFASTQQYLGKIQDAFSCCDKLIEIRDRGDNLIYEIKTTEFQIGFCESRNAEEVAEIKFKIVKSGNVVGYIIKMSQLTSVPASYLAKTQYGMNDKSNSFIINFPDESSPSEKLLLIIAAIMIGFQFFKGNIGNCCPSNETCLGRCLHCCDCTLKCIFCGPCLYI